ncbi:MAG: ABC transporter ATP-binding protein, partial [Acidobacteriota bacterium]|nr:ABC transporter ATP-binding protein [Acidobacteriota bacterium]
MHPHMPKRETESPSWRVRLASLKNIRPLLTMVWETSPALVMASVVMRLFRALIPLATLWIAKLIIDGIVAIITTR